MSYEDIINKVKKIESYLMELGAEGRGLHEKITSVEKIFDEKTTKAIRLVATLRNKYLHEDGFTLTPDLYEKFNDAYEYVIVDIKSKIDIQNKDISIKPVEPSKKKSLTGWEKIGFGALAITAAAVYGWLNP